MIEYRVMAMFASGPCLRAIYDNLDDAEQHSYNLNLMHINSWVEMSNL